MNIDKSMHFYPFTLVFFLLNKTETVLKNKRKITIRGSIGGRQCRCSDNQVSIGKSAGFFRNPHINENVRVVGEKLNLFC